MLTLAHSRQCGRVDDGDVVIFTRIPRRGGRPIPSRDRGPSVGRRSGPCLGEVLIGDADDLDLDLVLDGHDRLGVDGFGRCPDGLDRSVGVVLGFVHVERGRLGLEVLLGRRRDLLGDLTGDGDFLGVFGTDLTIAGEELHEHRGVVDSDGAQQFGRRIEVPLRAAGEDLSPIGVGDEFVEQRRRQAPRPTFPFVTAFPIAEAVDDLDPEIHVREEVELLGEGEGVGRGSVVEEDDIGLAGQRVDGADHRHQRGDPGSGREQQEPGPPVVVGEVEGADRAEHVEDGAGAEVVMRPGRHLALGVAFDRDRERPWLGRRRGDRIAARHRLGIGSVDGEVDVDVLPRSERQGRPVHATEDEDHHSSRLGDGLHAFGGEFLRVPRPQGGGGSGRLRGAREHAIPRHLQTAHSLGQRQRGHSGGSHPTCSRIRCTYQLMKASTWYSLFIYGPCS